MLDLQAYLRMKEGILLPIVSITGRFPSTSVTCVVKRDKAYFLQQVYSTFKPRNKRRDYVLPRLSACASRAVIRDQPFRKVVLLATANEKVYPRGSVQPLQQQRLLPATMVKVAITKLAEINAKSLNLTVVMFNTQSHIQSLSLCDCWQISLNLSFSFKTNFTIK